MNITKGFSLTSDVEFVYDPAKVDPFYYDEPAEKHIWRMRGIYSEITTEDGMWQHLAYNAILNGVTDASQIDGWADLNPGDLTVSVRRNTAFIEAVSS